MRERGATGAEAAIAAGGGAAIAAGGIAAIAAKTDPATTGVLVAVTYRHPAEPGRCYVRLVEESLRPAIDAEMLAMGFAPPEDAAPVGRTRRRARGFPAAAVVEHPKKAHFALDVMKDFRRAAARARTKPGHANESFAALAKKLERSVPAFLPSFWEEVGRTFLSVDALALAAQSFEKARAAERSTKLRVDEDERAAAYLEFATAGAVSAKSLAGYAGDLAAAFAPKEAARRFAKLNVQRIKAGLPPWTGMAKELHKLAVAAQLPELEAELLREILGAPSLKKAPPDFWAAYRPLLGELARAPAAKAKVALLFPEPRGFAKFLPTWLAFLEEIDAAAVFRAGPPEEAARFLTALTRFVTHDEHEGPVPAAYERWVAALAPVVVAADVTVDLRSSGWCESYALDVLETALAHGITPAPRPANGSDDDVVIDLHREPMKDPVHVAAHPVFGPLLDASVGPALARAEFRAWAAGKSGLVAARRRCVLALLADLAEGGLPRFAEALERLGARTTPATFAEMPEAAAALARIEVGPALARTLRGGILDELAWPDFEATLAAFGPKAPLELHGTVQHPVLRAGRKVVVFEGARKLRELDLPPAAKEPDQLLFLDGDLLITYEEAKTGAYVGVWASRPKSPFPIERLYGDAILDALPVPGGGVTLGGAVLHAGDTPKKLEALEVSSDGVSFWTGRASWYERLKLAELDPRTGKTGRASWPAFATDAAALDDGLRLVEVVVGPVPSPTSRLGQANGLTGHYARSSEDRSRFELVRIDGRRWQGRSIDHLFDWPGGVTRGIDVGPSWSRDEDEEIGIRIAEDATAVAAYGGDDDDRWRSAAFPRLPRAAWLHYLDARDEAASGVLRTVSDDVGRALARAAEADLDDEDALDDTLTAVQRELPGIATPAIARGVALVAKEAAKLARKLEELREADPVVGVDDDAVKAALPYLPTFGWNDGACTTDMARVGAAFRDGKPTKLTASSVVWERGLDGLVKLACLAASRAPAGDPRQATLRALVEGVNASGLPGLTVTHAVLEVPTTAALIVERPSKREAWLTRVDDVPWFVRVELDEDEPTQTVEVLARGALAVPAGAIVKEQRTFPVPDDRAFAEAFFRELEARGPAPFDPAGPALVAAESTLGAAEATLLLAGLPGFERYEHDFLGKERRTALGLKVTDAARAKEALEELPEGRLAALLAGMGDVGEPDAYWRGAAAEGSVARRLAATARRLFGRAVVLREEVLALLKKEPGLQLSPRIALTLLLTADDPDHPLLALPKKKPDWLSFDRDPKAFGDGVVVATARMLPLLAAQLPVGDPDRARLPVLYARVRAVLERPDLLVELGTFYGPPKERARVLALVGGTPFEQVHDGLTWQAKDDGLLQVLWRGEDRGEVGLRTSALPARRAELLPYLALDGVLGVSDLARAVLYLLSPACEALVDRIRKTPVPAGGYELCPLLSAKELVAEVRDELGVDDAAAALYLQVLALPRPDERLLLAANGWSRATYTAAAATLVKKKLLVEGKRERAGRSVFLPGGWEKKSQGVSVETYKLPLYDLVSFDEPAITTAPHELYARAWKRWSSGDRPGYESVEKRKPVKKKT